MGSMASCSRRKELVSPEAVRVVHLNGQLDEFPAPPGEELRLGELYFLLPLSVLESDLSPENLVALAARLYAAARKEVSRAAKRRKSADSTLHLPVEGHSSRYENPLLNCNDPEVKMAFTEHLISKSRSWRPCLHTIQETGFAC